MMHISKLVLSYNAPAGVRIIQEKKSFSLYLTVYLVLDFAVHLEVPILITNDLSL